MKFLSAV